MTLLEQQELMAPPPRRRLIVPKGHGAVWGVDPSTLRAALGAFWRDSTGEGRRWVQTQSFGPYEGPERLSGIYAETKHLAAHAAMMSGLPGLVMVEQPSGSKQAVNLPLIYAVGVIQAALWDALFDLGCRPKFESCTSSWWKVRACGRGNLYKPKREKGQPAPRQSEYAVFRWAVENGWNPRSWDEADAGGIAEAAAREVLLEER